MTTQITDHKIDEWYSTRKIKLKNKEKIKSDLVEMLEAILDNIDKLSDYDIFKTLEICEFTLCNDIWWNIKETEE